MARFDLSMGESSPAGLFLYHNLIRTDALSTLLRSNEYSVSIFNGGQHTILLTMSTSDFAAFLSLLQERFGDDRYYDAFEKMIRDRYM